MRSFSNHTLVCAIREPSQTSKIGVLEHFCNRSSFAELLEATSALDEFAGSVDANIYQRVRAIFQLYAIYRFVIPTREELPRLGTIPFRCQELILAGRFQEAIDSLKSFESTSGLTDPIASALSAAYHGLGFELLASQVQRSVRSLNGNRWMFRVSHALDYPLRVRPELLVRDQNGRYPVLVERTPVRMDLSHSGWSDIFFLGMDYPEAARVLNISVDLAVLGRDDTPTTPIRCFLRVIDEPVLRLVSVDLGASADLTEIGEVFDYARDYLGLLKAAVVASGVVPAGFEGSNRPLSEILERLVGRERGLELVSQVADIPKGSRLAVSTNLLGSLISLCMRATNQARTIEGQLSEPERRIVAGRAILGEWLGGSGGGWQDSGGVWPGIKIIRGVVATSDDVEFRSSRGRLLPEHILLAPDDVSFEVRNQLQDSLVVVHGGMAANVGPILEMVTEKFLLGTETEWKARQELVQSFNEIVEALRSGNIKTLGALTTRAFEGPLQAIVPWVSNAFTERLINGMREKYGENFWGFWMLGGMSGGGMGFIFDPKVKRDAEKALVELMRVEKNHFSRGLPFAIDPVAYRVAINESGTSAKIQTGADAILSTEYYLMMLPKWLLVGSRSLSAMRQVELEGFSARDLRGARAELVGQALVRRLLPTVTSEHKDNALLDSLLAENGFDREQHEQIRADLQAGLIGLAKNRIPADATICDVGREDTVEESGLLPPAMQVGEQALRNGEVAVVTLAAGAGSRWTQGAGTVKALHPFARLNGKFRTFIEVHLAKSRRTQQQYGVSPLHVFTTSYLTHAPIFEKLESCAYFGQSETVKLSQGKSIGLRLVPMARDLEFLWQQMQHQKLEERKEKVRESARNSLREWAITTGEGSDYRDNAANQCLHPVGHWYEVGNLLLNGTLLALRKKRPGLKYLLLHNIDTLGADLNPAWLGQHILSGNDLSFEVVQRRLEDRGGGLARVGGVLRLIEGLAFSHPEDEAKLMYYNSLTTWISVDALLRLFGLKHSDLDNINLVRQKVRALAKRLPTYITLKDVKRRWGNAQEDIFVVTQFEKLWGDMSGLPGARVGYFAVPRLRGQQLKDVAQLDGWVRDGSKEYVESICRFD
jgi:galactokinase/mevalonate kinase-like predicted kinase